MEVRVQDPVQEIKRLQRCINDLVSLLALPAIWSGTEPSRMLEMLPDALLRMLSLDFVCVRLKSPVDAAPVEILRVANSCKLKMPAQEFGVMLSDWLKHEAEGNLLPSAARRLGSEDTFVFPVPLGLHGEIGMLLAGSERTNFPSQTEKLLLSVAANQASLALREAALLREQKRIANELDQRVAERTAELAAANDDLRKEIIQRKLAEERFREEEQELKRSELHKATILDSSPDCIVAIDHEGCITEFNPAAEQTFGHVRKDVVGRHLADVIIPPSLREKHRSGFARYLSTGESKLLGRRLEMMALRADGSEFPVELTITRMSQDGPLAFTGHIRDISDRKLNDVALRATHAQLVQSEERWRSVFENSAIGVALADLNGRLIAANLVFQELVGYTEEELRGLAFIDITHEGDRASNKLLLGELLVGKRQQFQIEKRYRCKNGSSVWVRNNVSMVSDADGVPQYLLALSEDITERKDAEEALKGRERDLKTLTDSMPALLWTTLPDGHADLVNKRWCEYTGLSPAEASGWGWQAAVHPDDRPALLSRWISIIESGEAGEAEARVRRFDGEYRRFHFRTCPITDASGHIVKWCGVNTDVEDRRRAEEDLRRSTTYLAEAQKLSLTGSFGWSSSTDEHSWSDETFRIFEYDRTTRITSQLILDRVHPQDLHLMRRALALTTSGQDVDYECRFIMPSGVKYLHIVAHANRGRQRDLECVGAIQDVTARRLSEEALSKVRAEFTRVARITSLGALTASIAHEVNQPLSGIITNAGTCLRMLSADPPNIDGARETVRRTIRDGNRASDIIARLRTLYSKKEPSPETMDLNEATREVIALSLSELQRSGVTLQSEFADDLPAVVGDRVQLQQVILNLLRNAVDAMSTIDDRPRELLIRTVRTEENQVLSVKDSGVGLTPQAAEKIFEAFYTTKSDGMGIGLSVSRSIIEAHRGRIWAIPNDGPGCTFLFAIPDIRVDRPSEEAA